MTMANNPKKLGQDGNEVIDRQCSECAKGQGNDDEKIAKSGKFHVFLKEFMHCNIFYRILFLIVRLLSIKNIFKVRILKSLKNASYRI